MKRVRVNYEELYFFKRSWPCHGLPGNLDKIWFLFAGNGDLLEIEAVDEEGHDLDSADFDGPALVALASDAGAGRIGVDEAREE